MSTETTQDLAAKSGLGVTEIPRKKPKIPRYTSLDESVEEEIDSDDLHSAGWHHENECPAEPGPLVDEDGIASGYRVALESLHHQAHGPGSLVLCREAPCSSLSLDQLRGAAS